jgi:hypothetical protein
LLLLLLLVLLLVLQHALPTAIPLLGTTVEWSWYCCWPLLLCLTAAATAAGSGVIFQFVVVFCGVLQGACGWGRKATTASGCCCCCMHCWSAEQPVAAAAAATTLLTRRSIIHCR